jgi:hypothetical protein
MIRSSKRTNYIYDTIYLMFYRLHFRALSIPSWRSIINSNHHWYGSNFFQILFPLYILPFNFDIAIIIFIDNGSCNNHFITQGWLRTLWVATISTYYPPVDRYVLQYCLFLLRCCIFKFACYMKMA